MRSLAEDLETIGFMVQRPCRADDSGHFVPPSHLVQASALRDLRSKQISTASDFIRHMEAGGVLNLLGNGQSIDPKLINPRIQFCTSRVDHNIFRYAKLFQKVPTTNRVGRQIRALVYDIGQDRQVLMGILELTSGAYTLGCRDKFLDWSQSSRKGVKDKGLRRIMDLATIVALPPYNLLRGGKLMAALAFSDAVVEEVRRRYRSDLLGVVTTSATGLHCAILN